MTQCGRNFAHRDYAAPPVWRPKCNDAGTGAALARRQRRLVVAISSELQVVNYQFVEFEPARPTVGNLNPLSDNGEAVIDLVAKAYGRSEEHTSELQSLRH